MGTRSMVLVLVLASACSEPLLNNVPRPPAAQAAGAGAAAAAAATLLDPVGATRRAEAAKKKQDEAGAPPSTGVRVDETVPADVFDRLDRERDATEGGGSTAVGASGATGAAREAETDQH